MNKPVKVLLGITGSIAAYKSVLLLRMLVQAGYEVRVVLTPGAEAFVTPLTLQALSTHPVRTALFDAESEFAMDHIALARWADVILIAPATAHCIAKLANGLADDLLSTLVLASTAPLVVAPAMNVNMWQHPATQQNIQQLRMRGVHLLGPEVGDQACGDFGLGRMIEPEVIVSAARECANPAQDLAGKHVVITAGATREAIDAVRFLSNPSTGKMGFALAEAAHRAGARVTLIHGITGVTVPQFARLTAIEVVSAQDMYEAVLANIDTADVFVGSAAVADYRPAKPVIGKMKKTSQSLALELERTPDIIHAVACLESKPYVVGFAAETDKLKTYARGKLKEKNLDMIIANEVGQSDIGFASDDNQVTIVTASDSMRTKKLSKKTIAEAIISKVVAETTGVVCDQQFPAEGHGTASSN